MPRISGSVYIAVSHTYNDGNYIHNSDIKHVKITCYFNPLVLL